MLNLGQALAIFDERPTEPEKGRVRQRFVEFAERMVDELQRGICGFPVGKAAAVSLSSAPVSLANLSR